MKKRWRKFNFVEWRSDPDLRRCSREARSLWLDLVGLIYDAEDSGRLSIKGRAPSDRELADILGDDPRTVRRLMAELHAAGVYDMDQNFVVSRRILREEHQAKIAQEYGKRGGNPSLKNKAVDEKGVNPPLKLDTRDQKPEVISEAKASDAGAPSEPQTIKAQVWAIGRPMFEKAGTSKAAAGAVLGALIKRKGEVEALSVITAMRAEPPMDPEQYLWAIIRGKAAPAVDAGAAPQLELVLVDGKPVMRPVDRRAA